MGYLRDLVAIPQSLALLHESSILPIERNERPIAFLLYPHGADRKVERRERSCAERCAATRPVHEAYDGENKTSNYDAPGDRQAHNAFKVCV